MRAFYAKYLPTRYHRRATNLRALRSVLAEEEQPRSNLREVALLFLRLGVVAFGGPAAHIAMMRNEVVQRRKWVGDQEFLDMVGATNLIPGPNSTELAIHLGHRRAGWIGLLTAGALFIGPATLIVMALAALYVEYGTTPQAEWLLYGVKPVIIAIVAQALWGLGRTSVRNRKPLLPLIGIAAVALYIVGVNELFLLFAGGAVTVALHAGQRFGLPRLTGFAPIPLLLGNITVLPIQVTGFSMIALFLNFLKIGAVLYGSGYVLLAFLRGDFVERLGWLTDQQLIDAVAIGQITPGPLFTTATFVGYVTGGWVAALVATAAIFMPSFVFVGLLSKILPLVRRSPTAGAALDGVNVAALGLMAGVTWQLGRAAIIDPFTIALALVSLGLVLRTRLNSAWIVLGGAALGFAFKFLVP
ncbi:MAG: chromate efflux transporter [Chloroflexi bacterium]|nr:chromate efflux transporter [Chloroflexota bacterium]